MKKLFSLFTLLVAIVMGAWADNIYSFGFNQAILDAYDSEGTLLSSPSHDGAVIDISSTYNSCGDAYVTSTSAKEKCLSISNDASQNYDTYYLEIKSSEEIKNIYLVAAVTGSTSGSNAVIVGWKGTPSATIDEYQTFATPGKGATSGKEISITFAKSGIKCVRIYRKIKLDSSTKTTFTGSSATTIPGSASTYGISFIKVTTTPSGPVDPVFELSADEVEVGKTISVTGPDGLTFNAEPVSGTTGAVSVDGGTITGVTAGAAQVRVTSAATDDYNAYDHTFNITVTAAKIATELSFGTPTTTVARGEEVTNAATLTAGGEAISGTVTYSSDNEAVATVDATGKVTGVKVGTANIKANFAGDATYSAAEEVSYAITVTLPALTPVSNKIWTVKDAALLAEYPVNNSTKTKDITATNVIDNMEIVATSSKKMTMAYNANAATHADLPEGLTYRFQTLGMPGSDSDARYLHFKAAANSKVSAYFIQGTAGVNVAGYSLGTLDSENPTGICTNTAGDTGKMVFATGDTETDVYLYSASEGNSKGVQYIAVKVEPAATASVTLNAKGFATYSSDCAFAFSGAKAYKMALNESAKTMVGTEVNGEIAAGEGILFKGEAGATVTITLTSGAPSLAGNSLKGSTQADGRLAEKPEFCYALSGDTFKTFTGDALFANKAFFATENAIAQSFDIVFEEGEATAVDAIAEASEAEAAPVKVIKNGKLYIGNFNVAGQQVK